MTSVIISSLHHRSIAKQFDRRVSNFFFLFVALEPAYSTRHIHTVRILLTDRRRCQLVQPQN